MSEEQSPPAEEESDEEKRKRSLQIQQELIDSMSSTLLSKLEEQCQTVEDVTTIAEVVSNLACVHLVSLLQMQGFLPQLSQPAMQAVDVMIGMVMDSTSLASTAFKRENRIILVR